jgi:DNA-directed RNA polymerase specialized sigma24 family protein
VQGKGEGGGCGWKRGPAGRASARLLLYWGIGSIVPVGKDPESENVDSNDFSHILPGLRMMVFHQLGDISLAERIAQEALGRGILAMAQGEIRDGLPAEDFIIEIAHNIINNEIMDREA